MNILFWMFLNDFIKDATVLFVWLSSLKVIIGVNIIDTLKIRNIHTVKHCKVKMSLPVAVDKARWHRTALTLQLHQICTISSCAKTVFPSAVMAFHVFLCEQIPYSQTQLQIQSNNRGWALMCSCLRSLCKQCWKMAFVQRGTPLMTLHEKTSVFWLVFAEQNTFLFIAAYGWITIHRCCLQYGWQESS